MSDRNANDVRDPSAPPQIWRRPDLKIVDLEETRGGFFPGSEDETGTS